MSHLNGSKIKNLQVQITKLQLQKEQLDIESNEIKNRIGKIEYQIKKYTDELHRLRKNSKELIVSEHAILRYLERIYRLDMKKIEAEIAPNTLQESIKELGNGSYSVNGEFMIRVKDGVVITCITKDLR